MAMPFLVCNRMNPHGTHADGRPRRTVLRQVHLHIADKPSEVPAAVPLPVPVLNSVLPLLPIRPSRLPHPRWLDGEARCRALDPLQRRAHKRPETLRWRNRGNRGERQVKYGERTGQKADEGGERAARQRKTVRGHGKAENHSERTVQGRERR